MRKTRILLVEMPRMLRDIIKAIVEGQPDMEVVGQEIDETRVRDSAAASAADIVVVGLRGPELPRLYGPLFESFPGIRVLGVTGDGRGAFLWQLQPERTALGELSPQGLVDAVRAAVEAPSVRL